MKSVKRTDWGRRTPPIGGSNFELYAWFFMRVSGLFLVLLAAGHMFIMHVFNDTLNLDYDADERDMVMVFTGKRHFKH